MFHKCSSPFCRKFYHLVPLVPKKTNHSLGLDPSKGWHLESRHCWHCPHSHVQEIRYATSRRFIRHQVVRFLCRYSIIYIYLENKLLLISINFTPKTSHSCLKKWYTRFSRYISLIQVQCMAPVIFLEMVDVCKIVRVQPRSTSFMASSSRARSPGNVFL